ncbi:unnamed protein product [Moneuplotes crassus]|uniref:Uncharacterized protein n=1 Tax=Euplotes crassus TaxID=5936 RepID=A0AAD1UGC1_EUPCR|nr:unnamed protein product [Moneuplotes crassus]
MAENPYLNSPRKLLPIVKSRKLIKGCIKEKSSDSIRKTRNQKERCNEYTPILTKKNKKMHTHDSNKLPAPKRRSKRRNKLSFSFEKAYREDSTSVGRLCIMKKINTTCESLVNPNFNSESDHPALSPQNGTFNTQYLKEEDELPEIGINHEIQLSYLMPKYKLGSEKLQEKRSRINSHQVIQNCLKTNATDPYLASRNTSIKPLTYRSGSNSIQHRCRKNPFGKISSKIKALNNRLLKGLRASVQGKNVEKSPLMSRNALNKHNINKMEFTEILKMCSLSAIDKRKFARKPKAACRKSRKVKFVV